MMRDGLYNYLRGYVAIASPDEKVKIHTDGERCVMFLFWSISSKLIFLLVVILRNFCFESRLRLIMNKFSIINFRN